LFGLNSYYASEILQHAFPTSLASMTYTIKTDQNAIISIMQDIQANLKDHDKLYNNLKKLWLLRRLEWPFNEQTNQAAQSLIINLLAEINLNTSNIDLEPPYMTPIISFFFKLYEFSPPPAQITTLLLKTLSEKHNTIRISLVNKLTKNILTDLLTYLRHNNQRTQKGCCIIINLISDYINRLSSQSIRKGAYEIDQYKLPIDQFIIELMLDSQDTLMRCAGINLITLNDSNAYHMPLTLEKRIMNCQSNMEAKAWGRVIRYANIGDKENQVEEWKIFLERVLEKKPKALPAIYSASFSKYETLVVLQEYENFLDEDKLGLPFNREE
jgi:hypothetical protein